MRQEAFHQCSSSTQPATYIAVPTSTTVHMIPEVEMSVDTKRTHTADRCPGKVEWLLYPGGNTCRTCISSWQLEAYSQLLSYLQSALSHTNLYPSMSPQVSFLIRSLLFSQSTSLAPLTSVRLFYLAWQTETFLAIIPLQHHSQIETPILRVHLDSQHRLFHLTQPIENSTMASAAVKLRPLAMSLLLNAALWPRL